MNYLYKHYLTINLTTCINHVAQKIIIIIHEISSNYSIAKK